MGKRLRIVALLAVVLVGATAALARSWSSGRPEAQAQPASVASSQTAARADSRPGGRAHKAVRAVRPVRPVASARARQTPAKRAAVKVAAAAKQRNRARSSAQLSVAAVSVTLCAKAGNTTMPDGAIVPIWSLAPAVAGDCAAAVPALPGPVLEVGVGEEIAITLENELAENVSLVFPGLGVAPDLVGAAPGGTVTYTFTPTRPGTFLYEAGTNVTRQVAMGLYGALVVRPATAGQAYGPESAFDRESVLVLSELDPDLNANPNGFNLLDYAPRYWLINGKAYPETAEIDTAPDRPLLLRYVNASPTNHTMELLGAHQLVVAKDAYPASYPYALVSETLPAGSTADVIVTIPAATGVGTTLALYNRQLSVTNGAAFPGGMLTFIRAVAPGP